MRYEEIGYQQNYRNGCGGHFSKQDLVGSAKKTATSVRGTRHKTYYCWSCQKDGNFPAAIAQDTQRFEARDHYVKSQYFAVLESRPTTGNCRQITSSTDCQPFASKENTRYKCLKTKCRAKYLDIRGME